MLQWTTAGDGPRVGLIVHHTDAAREWAYGWRVASMKKDRKRVLPFERS